MSKPATAKASKNYFCSCGCGEKINVGHPVIVHMGDFYQMGHYHPEKQIEYSPQIKREIFHEQEPEQCKLQLF